MHGWQLPGVAGKAVDFRPAYVSRRPQCPGFRSACPDSAKPLTVIAALGGNRREDGHHDHVLERRPSVASKFLKACRVWASKSPASQPPAASFCRVWPAIQTILPPSVITAGENARDFCHVPRTNDSFMAPSSRPSRDRRQRRQCLLDLAPARLEERRKLERAAERGDRLVHPKTREGRAGLGTPRRPPARNERA